MNRQWTPPTSRLPLCALRQVVSARGPVLTLRVANRLWVLTAGADPRASKKELDAAGNGTTPWQHARPSFDLLLRPPEILAPTHGAILARLRKQLSQSRSYARDQAALGPTFRFDGPEPDLMPRDSVPHLLRAWPEAGKHIAEWEAVGHDLPRNTRHAFARLRDAEQLLRRFHALDEWLAHFPPEALAYVERHGFRQRRWALLNLWLRVPDGRELFDELPCLAGMLALWWLFRPGETHPMRAIRRLVRKPRAKILAWLSLPAGDGTLKLIRSLPGCAVSSHEIVRLARALRDPTLRSWLLNLGVPLRPDILRAAQPGRITYPILHSIAQREEAGPADARLPVADLYFDTLSMLADTPDSPLLRELTHVRSPARLWDLHERAIRELNLERTRERVHWTHSIPPPLPPAPWMRPLDTFDALADEARAMVHCVATYASWIIAGHYYAYAIDHPTGRATLGIFRADIPRWEFHQLRGLRNQIPSRALRELVEEWLGHSGAGHAFTPAFVGVEDPDDIPL